ncbi:hypothetical protein [Lebetimonas sp. JH292]|uniref:hypothetical protein n=1 Tax=Lebetimonas sp. JH292 TaxID=990068 RepID=UPI000463BF1B|nr:hypothetical protein [Lebetimonas sp. JH292]
MKKILLLTIAVLAFASKQEYLEYTNKLVTYNFKLNNIDKIKSPFFKPKKLLFMNKKINKNVKKIVHITLLSLLNNSAFIKIEEFMGDEKIKEYKKWVKKNSKVENCNVENICSDKIILNCNNKKLVKRLNEKTLKIRIEK